MKAFDTWARADARSPRCRVFVRALRLLNPITFALLLAMNMHAIDHKIVFDFQAATNTAAWQIVNDDVMGGVSRSGFRLTNGVAVFRGEVSLENNGGFASVRSLPARHDLTGCDGFVIRVRGDGLRYKFTARIARNFDSAIYQTVFTTMKGEWEEHRLPLKQFVPTFRGRALSGEPPLDPAKITSVGFLISDKQEGPFQLEVAWIKASPAAGN
jgi:NADH dehydrogenase [ubiquinone] 1 alpha subcomplex assembly factor 1